MTHLSYSVCIFPCAEGRALLQTTGPRPRLIYDVTGSCGMWQHGELKKPPYPHLSPPQHWSRHPFIPCRLLFRFPSLIAVSFPRVFLYLPCHFPFPLLSRLSLQQWKSHVLCYDLKKQKNTMCSASFRSLLFFLFCLLSLSAHTSALGEERGEDRHVLHHQFFLPPMLSHTYILPHPRIQKYRCTLSTPIHARWHD